MENWRGAEMSTQDSGCKLKPGPSAQGTYSMRLLPMAPKTLSLLTNISVIQRPFLLIYSGVFQFHPLEFSDSRKVGE